MLYAFLSYNIYRTVFVEMFVVEDSRIGVHPDQLLRRPQYYRGVYMLMEKIKRDKARVDIEKLETDTHYPNITGNSLYGSIRFVLISYLFLHIYIYILQGDIFSNGRVKRMLVAQISWYHLNPIHCTL